MERSIDLYQSFLNLGNFITKIVCKLSYIYSQNTKILRNFVLNIFNMGLKHDDMDCFNKPFYGMIGIQFLYKETSHLIYTFPNKMPKKESKKITTTIKKRSKSLPTHKKIVHGFDQQNKNQLVVFKNKELDQISSQGVWQTKQFQASLVQCYLLEDKIN